MPALTLPAFTVVVCAVVGLVGGALLPLPVYWLSVPAEHPLQDSCATCAQPLAQGVRGWLRWPVAQSNRCVGCGHRLGPPWWLTALTAGVASGVLAAVLGSPSAAAAAGAPRSGVQMLVLGLYVVLAVVGVGLAAIDVACRRLPHAIVVPSILIGGALLTIVAGVNGEWGTLLRAGLGAGALGAAFLVLFLVPGEGLGYGDVKLAVLLGLFLGWLGWRQVLFGGVLPWLVNAPVVLVLLARGRVDRKAALPFGPAMLVGALLSVVCAAWLDMVSRT